MSGILSIRNKEAKKMVKCTHEKTKVVDCPLSLDSFIHLKAVRVNAGGALVFLFFINFLTKNQGDTPSALLSQEFWELYCTQHIYF